jgi:hypothetical protein
MGKPKREADGSYAWGDKTLQFEAEVNKAGIVKSVEFASPPKMPHALYERLFRCDHKPPVPAWATQTPGSSASPSAK